MLGITLAPYGQIPGAFPYGVSSSYGGDGTFYCDDTDPMYNERGETGFYHDTQLGLIYQAPPIGLLKRIATMGKRKLNGLGSSIPGDIELSDRYGMTPLMSGWITTKEGFVQSPWVPPDGWRPGPLGAATTTPAPIGLMWLALAVGGAVAGAMYGAKKGKPGLYAGIGGGLGTLIANYLNSGSLLPAFTA